MLDHSKSDQEKSIMFKLYTDTKLNLFRVIYLLLKHDELPIIFQLVLSLIQYAQLTYVPFSTKLKSIWSYDTIADQIYSILNYTVITPHLINQSFSLYVSIFWICFGSIIFSIMIIIVVTFTLNQKSMMTLPLYFLRIILRLFLTALYGPYMGVFFGLLSCQWNAQGKYVMLIVPTQECWDGSHSIQAGFAIFAIVLFQFFSSLLAILYFEAKNVPGDTNAQRSGRPYSYYHVYLTFAIMSYHLLETPRFNALILLILLIGSFTFFYKIHIEKPFYSQWVQKLWSIISALNLWGIIMLTFAGMLEGIFFSKTIIGWLIGIPLIAAIIIREPEEEVDLLAANINRAESGDYLIKLCEYMLKLIDISDNNQNASLMLDGYIEIHKQTCPRQDCVLKVKKQLSEKFKNNPAYRNRDQTLIEIINQIYFYGIKSFPQDVYLRLNYSFFLIDRMKQKQQALTELQQAEQSGPSFDHEFIIYRYKRIIEDDLQEQQQENILQVDIVTEIAFQNQSKILLNKIERTALLHIDFWTQLQEDIPDIGKLNALGFKIMNSIQQVEDQWLRLKRLNQKSWKMMRLMGKYYNFVLNDDDQGIKLLQMARNATQNRNKTVDTLEDINNEQLPTIVLQTEMEKLGLIYNVNKATCSMVGYTKTDLINRKINILQPEIYSKHHDQLLEQFLERQSENAVVKGERLIFIKSKSSYILACSLTIRLLQTVNQGIYLCASFRQELQYKQQCYMILSNQGTIENISSMCIKMLGLELRIIQMRSVHINELFPELFDRREEYQSKQGGQVQYNPQVTKSSKATSAYELDDHPQLIQDFIPTFFTIYLQEITLPLNDDNLKDKIFGYVMKIEKQNQDKSGLDIQKRKTLNNFAFKYNVHSKIYIMEQTNLDGQDLTMKVDQSVVWEDATKITQQIDNQISQIQAKETSFNFGEGIKTMRLWQERIMDIEEQKSEEDEEQNEEQIQSVFDKNNNHDDLEDNDNENKNMFRNKQSLEQLLSQSRIPIVITNYKYIINIIILILIVIAYVEYFLGTQNDQSLQDSLPLLTLSNQRLSSVLLVQSMVQDLKFINLGYYNTFIQNDPNYVTNNKAILTEQVTKIGELQNTLTLSVVSLDSKYSKTKQEFEGQNVQMQSQNGVKKNYTFNDAMQQIIAKALSLSNTPLANFNDDNADLYFLQYNLYNSIVQSAWNAQSYYFYGIYTQTDQFTQFINGFISGSTITIFLIITSISLFFLHVQAINQQVLTLFLDLDNKNIKAIYQKCENFITNLQVGDDEDIQSDNDEKDEDIDVEQIVKSRKKRRRFKNSSMTYRNFLFGLFIIACILEGYFVFIYISTQSLINEVYELLPITNLTSFVEAYYRLGDNSLRDYIIDPTFTIFTANSSSVVGVLIGQLYSLDASVHQEQTRASGYLTQSYNDLFTEVFINNPCPILSSNYPNQISLDTCQSYANGVLQQGLSIGMTKFFENLRLLQTSIENNRPTDSKNKTYPIILLNSEYSIQARQMQLLYIRFSYQYLVIQLSNSIDQSFTNQRTTRLALFISNNAFIIMIYFFIWIPLIFRVTNDVLKIRQMLVMIPLGIVLRIKSIKQYIRKIIYQ